MTPLRRSLLAKKSGELLLRDAGGAYGLRPILGPLQLTSLGIGAIIGAGIFVIIGVVAKDKAGAATMLSFVVAGTACGFAALCYAEFASMVPIAGSAYTYAYATLGELFAWIIGWDLLLEYAVGAAVVANSWSSYFQEVMATLGLPPLPHVISGPILRYNVEVGQLEQTGTFINLPAVLAVAAVTAVLVKGINESARFNAAMVAVKL